MCLPDVDLPPYRPPAPLGGHLQTILPSLFRRVDGVAYRRERLELDDGDFLDLDWAGPDAAEGARLAVVAHGLEGSTERAYVRGMVRALQGAGWSVLAWNLRGCSGEPNRLARAYHSGATEDLDAVVRHALGRGWRRVGVVGFSLGGNLSLRWLGELGDRVPREIVGAVGVSVPVDLAGSAAAMEGLSRRLYMRRFLRSLRAKTAEKAERFPDGPDPAPVAAMRTFAAFDAHVTAPLHGFASAEDYWARASAGPLLSRIRVPTLLVNALDDPFLGPGCFPASAGCVRVLTPRRGGHVGFVARGGTFWSEATAVRWLGACAARHPTAGRRAGAPAAGRPR